MDSLVAIRGKDFVMVAADKYAAYSIVRMKDTEDKIAEVDGNKLLALAGPLGDRTQFGEYVRRNIHLHRMRFGAPLSVSATASFARSELAQYLRQNPYQVSMLLAGADEKSGGPKLYWIDSLASMVELTRAAHGYAAHFLLGLLDRYYKPDLTEDEALDILKMCFKELESRFLISQSQFTVKVVNQSGVRLIEAI